MLGLVAGNNGAQEKPRVAPQPEDEMTQLLSAIAKYGLPSVLVCWFAWFLMNSLLNDVRQNREMLQSHIEAGTRIEQSLQRSEARQDRIEGILRQSCVNAARDRAQQQACWAAGYK